MHSRLLLAIPEQKRQQKIFDNFTASLTEKGELENEWTRMILDWEKDPTKTNPYLSVVAREYNFLTTCHFLLRFPDASQDEVKKKLLEEEKQAVTAGTPQLHETGPTAFISMGLIIEESQ